jgi:hypothetical protein
MKDEATFSTEEQSTRYPEVIPCFNRYQNETHDKARLSQEMNLIKDF